MSRKYSVLSRLKSNLVIDTVPVNEEERSPVLRFISKTPSKNSVYVDYMDDFDNESVGTGIINYIIK